MLRRLIAAVITAGCASTIFFGLAAAPAAEATAKPRVFATCAQLNKVYPHGVGKVGARDKSKSKSKSFRPVTGFKRDNAVYQANIKRDGDRDGIACEKR